MDKKFAIKITNNYLAKLMENRIHVYSAYLFGSFAKGKVHKDSDIDLALILDKALNNFETEVKLMNLRKGEETLIEPHVFDTDDFVSDNPLIKEIKNTGIKLMV